MCRQEYSHRGTKTRVETGVLTSGYRDKSGEWSSYIEVQNNGWRQEYAHSGTKKMVETGVLETGVITSRYRDNG